MSVTNDLEKAALAEDEEEPTQKAEVDEIQAFSARNQSAVVVACDR